MYLIGIVVFMIGIGLTFTFKGLPFYVLANPSAVLNILFVLAATLLATSGYRLFVRGLNAAISRKYRMPSEERAEAADLFRLLSKVTVAAGVFGMFAGIIAALGHMEDAEALGHAVAAAFVSLFLGAVVPVMFFEPVVFILRRPQSPATEAEAVVKAYPKALGDKLLALCYQNGLTAEDIERATGIELRSEEDGQIT